MSREEAYHALAVCGDASCEYGMAQFAETFFWIIGGRAFEEEDFEICHDVVVVRVWGASTIKIEVGRIVHGSQHEGHKSWRMTFETTFTHASLGSGCKKGKVPTQYVVRK